MKRKIITLFVFATFLLWGMNPLKSSAQLVAIEDYNDVRIAGAGISVGYRYGFAGSRSLNFPPLNFYFEMGVHDNITVGPFLGFARYNYHYTGFGSDFRYNWSFIHIGGRGSYHLTPLINDLFDIDIDTSRWDFYATLLVGLEIRTFKFTGQTGPGLDYENDWRLFIGPIAGARYYLTNNIALYLEGGRGALGSLTFGVSATF